MDSDWYIYALPVLGFCFFFILHFVIRHCLRLFRKLTEADVYAISCRVVSAIQAIIASVLGLIIAYSCRNNIMTDVYEAFKAQERERIRLYRSKPKTPEQKAEDLRKQRERQQKYRHWLTNAYVYFGISYFPYDIWAMYAYNIRTKEHIYLKKTPVERIKTYLIHNKIMLIHHVILPIILVPIILFLRDNRGDFFFGVFYMIEIAVPFVSAREILLQLKMKNTRLYVHTSVVMLISFFLCRIAVFPYLYSAYASFANQSVFNVPFIIPVKCNIGCVLILVPQTYWFALMVRGLYRFLNKSQVMSVKEDGKIC